MRSWTVAVLVLVSSGCYETITRGDGGPDPRADAGPPADYRQFCTDRLFWECRRDQFAGRISDDEFNACIETIGPRCEGATWPAGCRPTQAEAGACIAILQRGDLAAITTEELYATYTECDLCP